MVFCGLWRGQKTGLTLHRLARKERLVRREAGQPRGHLDRLRRGTGRRFTHHHFRSGQVSRRQGVGGQGPLRGLISGDGFRVAHAFWAFTRAHRLSALTQVTGRSSADIGKGRGQRRH